MRSRKWMWATLVLTLVLGMSLGVLLDRNIDFFQSRDGNRQSRSGRFLSMLETELDLSSEQKEDLTKVLAANREKADAFWREARSSYAELRKEFREQIRTVLNPEQQERFDAMMAKHDAQREQRRKRDK